MGITSIVKKTFAAALNENYDILMLYWLQFLNIFINVSFHIFGTSLTLMALSLLLKTEPSKIDYQSRTSSKYMKRHIDETLF